MDIGVLKEIKPQEYRVGLTPACVREYCDGGHRVFVESGAGVGAGFSDAEYQQAGARVLPTPGDVAHTATLLIKVKEPLPEEYGLLKPDHVLYTYLHLAAAPELAMELARIGLVAIAYETITERGHLPCLQPMSEIAGRLAVQEGAKYLEKTFGGRGVLLGGVPGIERGKVVILGGGVVGLNACKIATGMGADVFVLDISAERLAYFDDIFGSRITTLYSDKQTVQKALHEADVVIGAVLVPGEKAPYLVRRSDLSLMKKGAVIVDVAIDQGGCVETSRPTSHDDPVYLLDDIVHYCVTNMPGVVALSSTIALTRRTRRYGKLIADLGIEAALVASEPLRAGANFYRGSCVHHGLASSLNVAYRPLTEVLA